ncbi:MAG: autoinducer binding domain-containing protein [Rhodospirillaceae bacterium]|nr:autoinducer binding domain-containing protein [Rhodospirillaceae bacterium]
MLNTKLTDITAGFTTASSLEDVRRELAKCATNFGCRQYTYVFVDIGLRQDRSIADIESGAEFLTNLDPQWAKHYLDRRYFAIDPIVHACYRSRMPVVWSPASAWPELDPDVMEMLVDAYNNGLRRGISVPIHGFAGNFGIFSLYAQFEEPDFQSWAENSSYEIQRFAFWFHDYFASRFSQKPNCPAANLEIRFSHRPMTASHTIH